METTKVPMKERITSYIEDLSKGNDRAVLANLRRSLTQESWTEIDINLLRKLGPFFNECIYKREKDAVWLTLAYYALWHSKSGLKKYQKGTPLGHVLQQIAILTKRHKTKNNQQEMSIRRILSADEVIMRKMLPGLIGQAASKNLPIDWADMYQAIKYWGEGASISDNYQHPARKWALDYSKTFSPETSSSILSTEENVA